ncbi:MAG: type II toxin-antitoxin system ParD family antitoxin [Rhodobacteraceae bacterium]|nr:type II toxin-antitoxin system ParD family antitoxin [Paracoccaceae bacterium]
MSVKASVSLSDRQDAFARELVRQGRYASLSAVVQRGLEMLREEAEAREAELAALRALLADRVDGDFVTIAEGRAETEAMIAARRAQHGF